MQNYKIILSYNGERYNGWQRQKNTHHTIQEKLENTILRITDEECEVYGAGRTDAGVHALGQVANFKLEKDIDEDVFLQKLNKFLPSDIAVLSISKADNRFHSRLNAKEKTYMYRISTGKIRDPFLSGFTFYCSDELDLDSMEKAADLLKGTHDFIGFSSLKKSKKSTVRTIFDIEIVKDINELRLIYHGNGFLYNMVRIITGTLIEIGEGKRSLNSILEVFETNDRQNAGFTAPGHGLYLVEVKY